MKKETINDLTTEKTELKREIGAFGGVSIIAGIMIGSGIFYLGAYVLQRVGMNSGLALLCWIIGGVISLFGGLAYAEMGAAMPQSGGRVVYLNEAYHPIVGFMNGFVAHRRPRLRGCSGPGYDGRVPAHFPPQRLRLQDCRRCTHLRYHRL